MRTNAQILGVREDATITEVKERFRALARMSHPDLFATLGTTAVREATERFRTYTDAYKELLKTAPSARPGTVNRAGFRPVTYAPANPQGFVPTVFRTATPTGGLVDAFA